MSNPQPQHTNRQYEEELRGLRTRLLKMGGMVERQIADAVDSLVSRNSDEAREVIARDAEVNRMDIDVEALCIRLLALRQPAAGDLRFITTGLKINYDLERIGDLAVNICERALELNGNRSSSATLTFHAWQASRSRWSRTASMPFCGATATWPNRSWSATTKSISSTARFFANY